MSEFTPNNHGNCRPKEERDRKRDAKRLAKAQAKLADNSFAIAMSILQATRKRQVERKTLKTLENFEQAFAQIGQLPVSNERSES
jgi:hypothetical protein